MRRAGWWLVALGVLSSAGFLALALWHRDLSRVAGAVEGARLWPWLPLAVASYLLGHLVRGARLRRLVSREATLSLPGATGIVVVGYAVNNVLPVRLGELARAWMLREKSGLPFVQSLTVTFLERLLDGLVLLGLLALTLLARPAQGWLPATLGWLGVLLGLAAFAVLLAVLAPGYVIGRASRVTNRLAPALHDRTVRAVSAMVSGVAYLRRPLDTLAIVGLTVVVWLLEAGMYLCLLPAFGLAAAPWTAVLAMSATNLGILIPSTPGFIGPFDFFCMQALVSTGVSADTALSYALVAHLAFLVPITLWGVGVLLAHGLTIGRAVRLTRETRAADTPPALPAALAGIATVLGRAAAPPAPVRPSRFMRALAESLVPVDDDGLAGEERRAAIDQVAEFVQGQIDALPLRLTTLFRVGLLGFRAATRVATLRGFCELEPERRRRWVEGWAYGRVSLARQLFRGPRSTALLAYYELPAVRSRLDRADGPRAGAR